MALTVRFFAAAKAAAGLDEFDVTLPDGGITLGDLEQLLTATFPPLGQVLPRCSYLRDEVAMVNRQRRIESSVRVVDVLPPFAGG